MKLRSYTLLFRLFSFLSDKTNGASFFVKYKLLLGTLIMGLISASACKAKKEVMCYVQIEEVPLTEKATSCYDSIVVKPNSGIINIKGTVTDKSGEPIADVSVVLKNSTKGTLTDMKGKFTLNALPTDSLVFSYIGFLPQTIFVSQIKENKVIILEEEDTILCYEVVVVEANHSQKTV